MVGATRSRGTGCTTTPATSSARAPPSPSTDWYERGPGTKATPWGDEDSPVFTTMAETALERELSATLMQHGRPDVRELSEGTVLTQQGDEADELFVILDGMVSVEVDGRDLGDLGPGAVVGERALLEGGRRTATLRAVTPVRVAAASASAVSLHALRQLTHPAPPRGRVTWSRPARASGTTPPSTCPERCPRCSRTCSLRWPRAGDEAPPATACRRTTGRSGPSGASCTSRRVDRAGRRGGARPRGRGDARHRAMARGPPHLDGRDPSGGGRGQPRPRRRRPERAGRRGAGRPRRRRGRRTSGDGPLSTSP